MASLMEDLCRHLSLFHAVLYENNPKLAQEPKQYEFWDSQQTTLSPSCLYILVITDDMNCEILQNHANFLVINNIDVKIDISMIQSANILYLVSITDIPLLTVFVQGFFNALSHYPALSISFLSELETDKKLENFLDITAKEIENTVLLFDADYNLISTSSDYRCGEYNTGFSFYPDSEIFLEYPIIIQKSPLKKQMIAGISIHGTFRYILVVLESNRVFQNSDLALLNYCGKFFSYFLETQSETFKRDTLSSLIEDIFVGKETEPDSVISRAQSLGFTPSPVIQLLVVREIRHGVDFSKLLEKLYILRDTMHLKALLYQSDILVFLKEYTDEILSAIRKTDGFKCGLSEKFKCLLELPQAYEQCSFSIRYGIIAEPDIMVYYYQNYRKYHFYDICLTDQIYRSFCLPEACEIVDYDTQNKTMYTYTLFLYLRSFKNVAFVAKALNIHKNTVLYRIDRIKDIFNLDFNNIPYMENLLFSFELIICSNLKKHSRNNTPWQYYDYLN